MRYAGYSYEAREHGNVVGMESRSIKNQVIFGFTLMSFLASISDLVGVLISGLLSFNDGD